MKEHFTNEDSRAALNRKLNCLYARVENLEQAIFGESKDGKRKAVGASGDHDGGDPLERGEGGDSLGGGDHSFGGGSAVLSEALNGIAREMRSASETGALESEPSPESGLRAEGESSPGESGDGLEAPPEGGGILGEARGRLDRIAERSSERFLEEREARQWALTEKIALALIGRDGKRDSLADLSDFYPRQAVEMAAETMRLYVLEITKDG